MEGNRFAWMVVKHHLNCILHFRLFSELQIFDKMLNKIFID